jgi:hypothetical protein
MRIVVSIVCGIVAGLALSWLDGFYNGGLRYVLERGL